MVELNVALENVCAQAQHALKSIHRKLRDTPFNIQNEFLKGKIIIKSSPCPVKFDTFERSFGYDGRRSRPIQQ